MWFKHFAVWFVVCFIACAYMGTVMGLSLIQTQDPQIVMLEVIVAAAIGACASEVLVPLLGIIKQLEEEVVSEIETEVNAVIDSDLAGEVA